MPKSNKIISEQISTENKSAELNEISIRGAREHNLKNIDINIPRDKFVVITGVSGSGKSSLAFDTIYAEGQRRYLECLSPYARQFMEVLKKPDVDTIEGLSPAISIEQKTVSKHPRSTVGTVTEIYDYLRLLFAKIGVQHCIDCKVPVIEKTYDVIFKEIQEQFYGEKLLILAPVVRSRKGHYKELFAQLIKEGYSKVRIDGVLKNLAEGMQVERYKIHDIELVVDRLVVNEMSELRLKASLEIGLKVGDSTIMISREDGQEAGTYSTKYSCPSCGKSYDKLSPNNFSFNSRYGSCRTCDGIGEMETFDLDAMVPDKSLSILDGAILTLEKNKNSWVWMQLIAFANMHHIDLSKAYSKLNDEEIQKILYGDEKNEIYVTHTFGTHSKSYKQKYDGLINIMKQLLENPPLPTVDKYFGKFLMKQNCPDCRGDRLKQESLHVLIHKNSIADITKMDIESAITFFTKIEKKLTVRELEISKIIFKEIIERLSFLNNVGLSYLNLARGSKTLSGGESQRIRLASQIGSQLVGITYVLDEPSIGLHQHDNYKLIKSLKDLRDLGNSVIVVEHDRSMIEESDWFIDIGPRAGVHGGEIIFSAEPNKLKKMSDMQIESSFTAQYLLNMKKIEIKAGKRKKSDSFLVLKGAKGHNLKNVNLKLPLGKFICVTGLSGSGKSSLVNDTLYPILNAHFYNGVKVPLPYEGIEGLENIDKIIEIDQSPIGKTARSNPATYTDVFTNVRNFFAMLPEAKIRGYASGRFSFNVKGGRCEDCQGAGIKKIEMNFLPDIYVPCDTCQGKRYNEETLQVKYKHLSIADVLDCTVEESLEYFTEIPKIHRKLTALMEVGLGYIKLGQQSPTLSGGEAQRVKLATELAKRSTGKTLYLLDEPTTGLHFEDIRVLLDMLDKLVEKGNTVVVIEHNMDVIKFADWIIDLGPEGGDKGGYIIAEGTPQEIAGNPNSLTGKYLQKELI